MNEEFESAIQKNVMQGFVMLQQMREATDPMVKEDLRDQVKTTISLINAGNAAASRTTSEKMQEKALEQRIAEWKHKVEVTEPQAHEEKMAALGLQARWLDLVEQGKAVATQYKAPKAIETKVSSPALTNTSDVIIADVTLSD